MGCAVGFVRIVQIIRRKLAECKQSEHTLGPVIPGRTVDRARYAVEHVLVCALRPASRGLTCSVFRTQRNDRPQRLHGLRLER